MRIDDYEKIDWQPHIVDLITCDVMSEGARFTSKRTNAFEDGIFANRELHKSVYDEMLKLKTELEIIGRVPGGSINGFKIKEEYCIYDNDKYEFIKLKEVKESELVFENIEGQFSKNARITKTNVKINGGMAFDYFINLSAKREVI